MKIGDEVYVHGFIDEIRQDTVIIRNDGGYFGTVPSEVADHEPTAEYSSDVISRQAAIDAVHSYFKGKLNGWPREETEEGYEVYCDMDKIDAFLSDNKYLSKRIENLPSAQLFTEEQIQTMQELEAAQIEKAYGLGKADRPKWIPLNAKGREPEDNGEYLLQLSDGFITATYYDGKDWELWADAGEPVAWMPLPEAYREDGEKE